MLVQHLPDHQPRPDNHHSYASAVPRGLAHPLLLLLQEVQRLLLRERPRWMLHADMIPVYSQQQHQQRPLFHHSVCLLRR